VACDCQGEGAVLKAPVISPKRSYDAQNEATFREEVRSRLKRAYDSSSDLRVPFGKKLSFTSAQGQVITFGYNVDGAFTIQQGASTPFGLASISYVSTVESTLESSIASVETTLTAEFDDLSASVTTISVAFADIETSFAALTVEVEAANDAAAAAATSASSAATSATAAGTSATAANTSATTASTQASNASTSASQASTSETNAAGSAATATTQATNAASSQSAAAGSASAASTSASTASTQATNASTSASAAATSATTATTQASNASTSASSASTSAGNAAASATTATTQASNAAGSASSASSSASSASASASAAASSATLSATFAAGSQGSINSSATFADNTVTSGVPTNWTDWSNGSGCTRVTGIAPQPYAFTLVGGAGANAGVRQYISGALTKGFYVLEADVTLNSGALTGAGVWFDWLVATVGTGAGLVFATDPDVTGTAVGAGTTGRLYRFRKLVEVPGAPDNGHTTIYAMSHWSGHGSIAAANSITWHRCAIRAASQAEVEARQAKNDLVTTNANVATNTSAIATETSARTSADTTLRATIYGKNDGVIPDADMRDSDWWNLASGCTFDDSDGSWRARRRLVFANGTYDQYSEYFPVEPGGTYRIRCRIWNNAGSWSGYFHPTIHVPAVAWFSLKHGYAVDPSIHDAGNGIVAAVDTGEIEWIYTNPTGVSGNANRQWQFRFSGSFTGGPVVVTVEIIRLDQYAAVTTNASAIATVNGAAAFWETIVSASGGDLSAVRLKAGASGAYIELISTVLRLANVSNGAVIEVMRAISGEAYFSRPISSDSGARRVTIGPGYGVSGQEVVLWFGPVGTAPSGQSRTNGYFALGTDGKVYYGASELGAPVPQLSLDTVGLQVDLQTWPTDAQVNFTLTASGGVAPYTYAATKLSASGYAFSSSGLVVDDFEAVMTGTSGTTRNGSETWLFSVTDDDGTVVSTVGQISLTVFG
jgi:hypothetical protein